MPLVSQFRSTVLWKAFTLNAIASSLIILIAITVKSALDNYSTFSSYGNQSLKLAGSVKSSRAENEDPPDDITKTETKVTHTTSWFSILTSFLVTFIITLISYIIMYEVFGFGGGMLVNT